MTDLEENSPPPDAFPLSAPDELDSRAASSAVFSRDASYRKRTIPRPSSLPAHRLTATDMAALNSSAAHPDLDHSDPEGNLVPVLADRVPSALLPPVQRPLVHPVHGTNGISKSFGTSRMAFMRRPKRTDSVVSKTRRTVRDVDQSGDEASIIADDHYTSDVPINSILSLPDVPAPSPVPEGSLKKRVNRIEKTIAEQTAWVRSKFDLEETDALLDSCSAALVRKIMLQGRLHITSSHMCFYAKIFGSVTKEKWPFSIIQSVKKRRGGFVANSIKITFANPETPPVIIASLNRREQTLAIITSRLNILGPTSTEAPYRGGSVEEDSEDQSDGINARDAGYHADHNRSDRSNSSTPQMSMSDAPSRTSADGHGGYRGSDTTSEDIPHVGTAWEKGRSHSNVDNSTRAALDKMVWVRPGEPMDMIAGKEYSKRVEQVRGTFDVPVVFAFNTLFIGDWYKLYHAEINNINVQGTEWNKDDEGFMRRDVSFRRPLGYRIGPKETRVEEIQRYCFTSEGGVRVEIEGHSLDAPFGDYFRVETYLELHPTSNGRQCELVTFLSLHFMKSTMLKSKIESGALAETKETFTKLIEMGKERIAEVVPKSHVIALLQQSESQKLTDQRLKPTKNSKASRPPSRKPAKVTEDAVEKVDFDPPAQAVPPTPVEQPKLHIPSKQSVTYQPQQTSPTIIQMHDAVSSQLLRVVTLAALVMVCILLVLVLLSFRRMKHEFKVLQAIVREMQATSASRAASNVCSK